MGSPAPGGEHAFLAALRSRAATPRSSVLRLGIGDDCAVLRPSTGHDILVTTDMSLEGRHFRRDAHPPASVGHRCLARGLSDLAAMGAAPLAAFLSLALPSGFHRTRHGRLWTERFLDGLLALAAQTKTPLAGGDTASATGDLILADIVLIGSAPHGRELRRSTARPGDLLYVTGALGGSAAELRTLLRHPTRLRRATFAEAHPHLFPQPRLRVGSYLLRRRLAHAAIDISDGLSTDLQHLCDESGVSALLDPASLPIHPSALALGRGAALEAALHGGEDYELLFTAAPGTHISKRIAGIPVTRIGHIAGGPPAILLQEPNGVQSPLSPAGWEHSL